MLELATLVIELTGPSSKLILRPLPVDDPQQGCPDISLAHKLLDGWEPQIQLCDGLMRTITYFDELLRNRQK